MRELLRRLRALFRREPPTPEELEAHAEAMRERQAASDEATFQAGGRIRR